MRSRGLGRSEVSVSELTLGTMNFGKDTDRAESHRLVGHFLDQGGTTVDTADCYGDGRSESVLGELPAAVRERLIVCTKTGRPLGDGTDHGYAPRRLRRAIDASLSRLRREQVDIYVLHQWDPSTPVAEAVDTLATLSAEGKIRSYGLGNMPGFELGFAHGHTAATGSPGPAAYQFHYSLTCRDAEYEILPSAARNSAGLMAWSPLSGGLLTGKYRHDDDVPRRGDRAPGKRGYGYERGLDRWRPVVAELSRVGREVGCSPAQAAVSWVLRRPAVSTAIIGARSVEQLRDLVAQPVPILLPEHLRRLDEVSAPRPVHPYDFLDDVLRDVTARP